MHIRDKMNKLLIIGAIAILAVAGYLIFWPSSTGKIVMQITDAPAELSIEKAMITISQVQVHMASAGGDENTTVEAGWQPISNESKTFDLIAIKDVKEFLGSAELKAGKYTQIRLSIDKAVITINGTEYELETPSDKLKLIKPFDITAGETTTLILDFDAQESIRVAGKDKYNLVPTIKVIQE